MIKTYLWKDEDGNLEETESYDTPPTTDKQWRRVYSVGIGRVGGAGGSPSKPPSKPA